MGSMQSRAAARQLLESRTKDRERLEIILSICATEGALPKASTWTEDWERKKLVRTICVPEGMTLADGLRTVGGFSDQELEQIAKKEPGAVLGGSTFVLRR